MCFIYSALGGDLHRHCIAYDSDEPASSRSEREVVFLLRQILEGVKHMHDQDYVHLDIKVRILQCWYYVWVVLASECLFGFKFCEGLVTPGDFSKHSTVNFLCHTQIQSIYLGRSLFAQQVVCNKRFPIMITVWDFFLACTIVLENWTFVYWNARLPLAWAMYVVSCVLLIKKSF